MAAQISEPKTWVKGIIALYILRLLRYGPAHGHKIAEEIKRRTGNVMTPNPNALYPLLRKMEERGYITGGWDHPDKRCKRIYTITAAGVTYIPQLEQKVAGRFAEMEQQIRILRQDLFNNGEESFCATKKTDSLKS